MSRGTKRTVYKLTDTSHHTPFKERAPSVTSLVISHPKQGSFATNPSPPRYPLLNQKLSACVNLHNTRSQADLKGREDQPNPGPKKIRDGSPATTNKILNNSLKKQASSGNLSMISSNGNSFSLSQLDSSFHLKSISNKQEAFTHSCTECLDPKSHIKQKSLNCTESDYSLNEKIKVLELNEEKIPLKYKLSVIKQALEEISNKDQQYGPILKKIKLSLDQYVREMKTIEKLNEILKETKEELERVKSDNKNLLAKVEILSNKKPLRTNSQDSSSSKGENSEVVLKLIEENKELTQNLLCAQKELKKFQIRDKKYMMLITEMKNRGYPVDEIYDSAIKSSKRSNSRGKKVPTLPLADVKNCISISTGDSDLTGIESQATTGHNITSIQSPPEDRHDVPKLKIPMKKSTEFHQEFMSKFDEFSESWRHQMDVQKR
ncbi:unnamed protein product [Blepharisma stoltei]|uniref:Uncharacterized protein n=1 Tax=Blepharisma stoltei TaxID=1481888 RepID=A0AAU9IEY1_9CILI|nr:unnamed protein product [Blepharisma stoltei]